MDGQLTFFGWQRSGIYDLPGEVLSDNRLRKRVGLTLHGHKEAGSDDLASGDISFLVMNSSDITGLQPQAIVRTMPPPNTRNVETTKCVYVEFAASDLPWRFSQESSAGGKLRPWIVLVAGLPEEVILQANGKVMLKGDPSNPHNVFNDHDLSKSALWAHVQLEDGKYVARLLSPRVVQASKDYVAAIVPVGSLPTWPSNSQVTLDCYYSWKFQTGNEGDFKTLAARLNPGVAGNDIGSAPVNYTRRRVSEVLSVRGALALIGSHDPALPTSVGADLARLTRQQFDPLNRPIISLPRYGAAWISDPEGRRWAATLNGDPRHRGVAGLGLWAGIALQEMIVNAASEQVGALDIAAQRIRQLTFGLQANRSLWLRRLPTSPEQRLLIYGPSLRRMVTDQGPVLNQMAGGNRPLPPNLFSTAARRVLRMGPARTSLASPNATKPSNLLSSANSCPTAIVENPPGLPHANSAARELSDIQDFVLIPTPDEFIKNALEVGRLPRAKLMKEVDALVQRVKAGAATDNSLRDVSGLIENFRTNLESRDSLPHTRIVDLLDTFEMGRFAEFKEKLNNYVRHESEQEPDDDSLLELGRTLMTTSPVRVCNPVDLRQLESALTAAIDPTVLEPFVQKRVLSGISGLSGPPLAPPEVCVGLDLPAWRFLRDFAPDWLLPGVSRLAKDSVIALESNPIFVDAFLLGLNTQILNELRWRNIPIASGCTPIKMFWGQLNATGDQRERDILGVETWPANSELGHVSHHTPSATVRDVVLVVRGELFQRYPETLVYISPATLKADGSPDWIAHPDITARLLPTFQGSIGDDIVFFRFPIDAGLARKQWVVFEEFPTAYSFFNSADQIVDNNPARQAELRNGFANAINGAQFAAAAFVTPLRILICGEKLIP